MRLPHPTGFCLVAALVLLPGCGDPPGPAPLASVRARVLRPETVRFGTRFSASVKPRVQMDLSFKVAGTVAELGQVAGRNVQEGDLLDRSAVVARLETRDYEQARATAEAALGQAEAGKKQAEANRGQAEALAKQAKARLASAALAFQTAEQQWKRVEAMSAEVTSQKEKDDARNQKDQAAAERTAAEQQIQVADQQVLAAEQQVRAAELQVQSARVALQAAADRLADCFLRVPFDHATVAQVNVQAGERVNAGQPVFRLIDVATVHVAFGVPDLMLGGPGATEGAPLRLGDRLDVAADAFPGETFSGLIRRIAPVADPNTRTFQTELALDNPGGRLRPGMIVRIRVRQDLSALLVPMTAVQRGAQPGDMIVYVLSGPGPEARVAARRVKLGGLYNNQVELLAGSEVVEGNVIVATGGSLVSDGQTVRVVPEAEEEVLQ